MNIAELKALIAATLLSGSIRYRVNQDGGFVTRPCTEEIDAALAVTEELLNGLGQDDSPAVPVVPAKKGSGIRAYWAHMNPEERAAEMRRRQAKWKPEAQTKWKSGLYTQGGSDE